MRRLHVMLKVADLDDSIRFYSALFDSEPTLKKNDVGYTRRDYEGSRSTLCAGCGHDSISAAIIQACYELSIAPHRVALACQAEDKVDVRGNRTPQQHRALKDQSLSFAHCGVEWSSGIADGAAGWLDEPVQQAQQQALASAVRPHDDG